MLGRVILKFVHLDKKKGGKVRSAEADGAEDDEQESSDEAKTNSVTVTERVLGTFGME